MPHQCIACGRGFPDGSRQMLSGCPDCGGTTFQFVPDGRSGGGGVVDGSGGVADGVGSDVDGGRILDGGDGSVDGAAGPPSVDGRPRGVDARPPEGVDADDELPPAVGSVDGDREGVLVEGEGTEDDAQAAARGSLPGADRLLGEPSGEAGADGAASDDGDAERATGAARSNAATPDAAAATPDAAADAPDAAAATPDATAATPDTAADAPDAAADAPDGVTSNAATPDAAADGGPDAVASDGDRGPSVTPTGGAEGGESDSSTVEAQAPETTVEDLDADTVAAELDSQFESIRIVEPGRYVINPVELIERDEQFIAVRENGRYVIDVAGSAPDEG